MAAYPHKLYALWPGQLDKLVGFCAMTSIGSSIKILFEPLHLDNGSLSRPLK